jgi:cell division ATPase FtsA
MQRHQEASCLASLVQDVSACGLDILLVVIGPIASATAAGHA